MPNRVMLSCLKGYVHILLSLFPSEEPTFDGALSSPKVLRAVTLKKYVVPSARFETVALVVLPTLMLWLGFPRVVPYRNTRGCWIQH
jgi:hypothetical protein